MTGSVDNRKLVLTEGKTVEVILDYGEAVYVRVGTFGQNSPLVVNVKRSKGKLVTFVSKTNPEPMEALCDSTFRGDFISVSDASPRFHCKNVYLNITAQADSVFTLRAQFGRMRPTLSAASKLPLALLADAEENDWMALLPQPSMKTKSTKILRNFIEENRSSSPSNLREKRNWKSKHEAVLRRLQSNLTIKKEKALSVVNKREIQRREKALLAKNTEIKANREKVEKWWFSFITFVVISDNLTLKLDRKMKEIAMENKRNAVARKIQRNFKLQLGIKKDEIALIRFQHSAQLLTHHSFLPLYYRAMWKIYLCIRQTTKNASFGKGMDRFSRAVRVIQRRWRVGIRRKKGIYEKLAQAWNRNFTVLVENLGKKKTSRRGKRPASDTSTARYFAISSTHRQRTLQQYYLSQKQRFLTQIREFLVQKEGPEPVFTLNLEEETMKMLIDKAAEATEETINS